MKNIGLSESSYEELLKTCSDKIDNVNDLDWSDIVDKYHLDCNKDTLRKAQQTLFGGAAVRNYYIQKYADSGNSTSYQQELMALKDSIAREKRQLFDQRHEYNKIQISDARAEHLTEKLIESANTLNTNYPLMKFDKPTPSLHHKEAVMCWSDWHYGMVADNIWNQYNTDICKDRIKRFIEKSKEYIVLNNTNVLNIVMLGDAAHGSIHTTCRVQSEEDTCDQLMNVAEIMAQCIDNLSALEQITEIKLYSCYGNHLRTIQNKNDSIHSDNMEKIIPWWLKERLSANGKVTIIDSTFKEFTLLNVLGKKICCIHGDLDNFKNVGVTANMIFSKKFGETIDYTFSGDKHHLEEFEQYGIESVLVRSLCGTDEYANNGRLYGKSGQTLMIFNDEYGRESTYNIPLD